MTTRTDRLAELLLRMREAYEVGSPLMVQQRLLSDFCACLALLGAAGRVYEAPLSEELLRDLETRFSGMTSRDVTARH